MGMIRDPERQSTEVAAASTRWLVIRTKPGGRSREEGDGDQVCGQGFER